MTFNLVAAQRQPQRATIAQQDLQTVCQSTND